MKILVVCQYYYPEPFRLPDLCEEMLKRGHEVTVLTGVPNYPMGKIYPGYEKKQKRVEILNGVHVIRCATIPRKTGTLYRMLNYFSYPVSAWIKAGKLPGDYDTVFTNQQSPVMMCWPAIRYARKNGKKVLMYCMDLWPASLAAGGISQNSIVYKVFSRVSAGVYRKMDRILVTSKMFMDYLAGEFGIPEDKMEYLPQYAEGLFQPLEPRKPDGHINLVFAGNVGTAQSLDTVIDAASRLDKVQFHIVGDGVELDRLKAKAGANVKFYGRRPLEEMPTFYEMADAMIVTLQADPFLSLTLPGKVQTYMAAGKPILAAANGAIPYTIAEAKCGYCAPAEDSYTFAGIIRTFLADPNKKQLGINARSYYEQNFTKHRFIDRLEEELRNNV